MAFAEYSRVMDIPIDKIRPPKFVLRPVRTKSVRYAEMLDSIREHGVLQPVLVRPVQGGYELVVGNHRFTCSKQLHHDTIPCVVRDLTDSEVLCLQIQENAIHVETQPIEYAVQLEKLMERYPDLTVPRLAIMLHKSPTWISKVLSLRDLHDDFKQLVRRGELKLTVAYDLAKLPVKIQPDYIELALTRPAGEVIPLIRAKLKEYREAVHRGYIQGWVDRVEPYPYLRKFVELVDEYKNPAEAGSVLEKSGAKTVFDAWKAALAWVLHLDPDGCVEQQRLIAKRQDTVQRAAKRRKEARDQLRFGTESAEE